MECKHKATEMSSEHSRLHSLNHSGRPNVQKEKGDKRRHSAERLKEPCYSVVWACECWRVPLVHECGGTARSKTEEIPWERFIFVSEGYNY